MKPFRLLALCVLMLLPCLAATGLAAPQKPQQAPVAAKTDAAAPERTMVVTAEGLADPNGEAYARDKGLLLDALRADAKNQILEKAVGAYVESSTLVENYAVIKDRVFSRSQGIIKKVLKESEPWVGDDGFAHLLLKAEVYVGGLEDALKEMSRDERVAALKEYGNPRISAVVNVRDAARGLDVVAERSPVAENIIKERIKSFGYRIWSDDGKGGTGQGARAADFAISGEAKFKTVSARLPASGLTVTKYVLTSLTIKCVDNHTGEEIYYNSKVPQKQSWADEDQALEEVGRIIGGEFSKEFFAEHLQAPAKTYQLQVSGLPSYDAGQLVKKEFIGLRPVLNVDFREFDKSGSSLYEVEFVGTRGNFGEFLQKAILVPLNQKMGQGAFTLTSAHGDVVKLEFASKMDAPAIMERLGHTVPASLAQAPPERLRELVKSDEALKKVAEVVPDAAKSLTEGAKPGSGLDSVKNF
jgi:serine/threonine-protein kinase